MERAPPIDVQLASLCSPETRGTTAVVILENRRSGWGLELHVEVIGDCGERKEGEEAGER